MRDRATNYGLPFAPPYFPNSLLDVIAEKDPVTTPFTLSDASNPFFGKKVLVLSGADDTLVPWRFSQDFVERLEVGSTGFKKSCVFAETGHTCSPAMVEEMAHFLNQEILGVSVQTPHL